MSAQHEVYMQLRDNLSNGPMKTIELNAKAFVAAKVMNRSYKHTIVKLACLNWLNSS